MKFRSIYNHLSSEIEITLHTFSATAALIILISIILSIVIDQKDQNYQFLLNTMLSFSFSGDQELFCPKSIFHSRKKFVGLLSDFLQLQLSYSYSWLKKMIAPSGQSLLIRINTRSQGLSLHGGSFCSFSAFMEVTENPVSCSSIF